MLEFEKLAAFAMPASLTVKQQRKKEDGIHNYHMILFFMYKIYHQ